MEFDVTMKFFRMLHNCPLKLTWSVCVWERREISKKNYFKSRAFKVFIPSINQMRKEAEVRRGVFLEKRKDIVTFSSYTSEFISN